MIDGVSLKQLKVIPDERGRLLEIFRVSDNNIQPAQVYMTTAYEGVAKDKHAFHMHNLQTDNMCCIKGKMKIVIVDTREGSPTKGEVNEFVLGDENFGIVTIPPQVLHAFKSLVGESMVINVINQEYNHQEPDEVRIDNKYYDWDKEEKI